ncbi:hypothetical protein JMJ77_0006767 [Colletotrichum scovillei]|uniref:Uncharacterized protein n=1 Tax=Colletotrichum scovillei TaxID=1209932 RepID=A0A9P7RJS7_9PEZI|nr:hypothetical protein JMJ77_0006767 [Colletotrichum scovillei]KAG7078012.1 hypothetical protein JMJ76_0015251 [Colletotrichum scovillei]KAG7085083.1 hypothetical protein JMJ78_0010511 [Colletotrichum scovillei]
MTCYDPLVMEYPVVSLEHPYETLVEGRGAQISFVTRDKDRYHLLMACVKICLLRGVTPAEMDTEPGLGFCDQDSSACKGHFFKKT